VINGFKSSDGDPFISRKRILIDISRGLDSILILNFSKISNIFVFLHQVNIQRDMDMDKAPFSKQILKNGS
jgi:hypothetical protein